MTDWMTLTYNLPINILCVIFSQHRPCARRIAKRKLIDIFHCFPFHLNRTNMQKTHFQYHIFYWWIFHGIHSYIFICQIKRVILGFYLCNHTAYSTYGRYEIYICICILCIASPFIIVVHRILHKFSLPKKHTHTRKW